MSRWLWAVGAVVLVIAAGVGTWQAGRSRAQEVASAQAAAETGPTQALVPEHDYYVHVKLIAVTDRMPGDKPWDRADGSAPDLRFSLTWHKNVIWTSIEKPNALIGNWDLMKVDLKQIILTTGGQADLADLVNAPLVHYTPGETVALKVWDEDPVGSDEVGKLTFHLDDLKSGDNTLSPSGPDAKALKRVIVTVIDRRTPIPELAELISNR